MRTKKGVLRADTAVPFDLDHLPSAYAGLNKTLVLGIIKQHSQDTIRLGGSTPNLPLSLAPPSSLTVQQAPISDAMDTSEDSPDSPATDPPRPTQQLVPWPNATETQHPIVHQQAIATLGITGPELEYFHSAHYCIFPDIHDEEIDYLLRDFLKAKRVPANDSRAKIVFWLPKLQDRRRDAPQVSFFLYGLGCWD